MCVFGRERKRLMKIDKTVRRETLYIICGNLVLGAIEQLVFLSIGKWSPAVLFSNLLMSAVFILDFFFLGLTLQRVVTKKDEKEIKNFMLLSRGLRLLMIGAALVVGILLEETFNLWALIPPLFFNRITLFVIQWRMGKEEPVGSTVSDCDESEEQNDENS